MKLYRVILEQFEAYSFRNGVWNLWVELLSGLGFRVSTPDAGTENPTWHYYRSFNNYQCFFLWVSYSKYTIKEPKILVYLLRPLQYTPTLTLTSDLMCAWRQCEIRRVRGKEPTYRVRWLWFRFREYRTWVRITSRFAQMCLPQCVLGCLNSSCCLYIIVVAKMCG